MPAARASMRLVSRPGEQFVDLGGRQAGPEAAATSRASLLRSRGRARPQADESRRHVVRDPGRLFPVEPVRVLDAVHLASIERLASALPNLVVISIDDRVRRNAEAFGLEVRP